MLNQERQAIVDGEHLRALSICYFVSAGMNALASLLGLLYAFMGFFLTAALSQMSSERHEPLAADFFGVFFGLLGLGLFMAFAVLAALKVVVARRLPQRRSRTFCLFVAGVSCLGIPYGTVLGVFTFLVLSRPSVVRLFDAQDRDAETAVPRGGGA